MRLKSSVLIFFAEKMWGAFALQKFLTFFQQKMAVFLCIIFWNFNVTLTNNVVSFEQLGPGHENCCIHPKIWTVWFYHILTHPNNAEGMENSVETCSQELLFPFNGASKYCCIHFEQNQSLAGMKTGDPREKTTWQPASTTWLVSCDPSQARTYSGEMTSDFER